MHRSPDVAPTLMALSVATDMTRDRPPGSAVRACLFGMLLAGELGLDAGRRRGVFYASLLRFLGCSSFAHELSEGLGVDDRVVQGALALVDPDRPGRGGFDALRSLTDGDLGRQLRLAAALMQRHRGLHSGLQNAHGEIATRLVERLGLGDDVVEAVSHIFERWDGRGRPRGLAGEGICEVARVVQVAYVTELALYSFGAPGAAAILRERAGASLDPAVVAAALGMLDGLAVRLASSAWSELVPLAPTGDQGPQGVDGVIEAFADFIDLKSTFRAGHSFGVASLADAAAVELGLGGPERLGLRRAALLHDLGLLSVRTSILDKRGPLSPPEEECVRLHAYFTERVLARSPLAELAPVAGADHERIDGSGYPKGLPGGSLPMTARLLAAADVYRALVERRPHREPFEPADVARVLGDEARAGRLDGDAVSVVLKASGHAAPSLRAYAPDGLTSREVEVLRFVAEGLSDKEVGQRLAISHRTVHNHVNNVYAKIGVSSRAAAALYAVEHGLLPRR